MKSVRRFLTTGSRLAFARATGASYPYSVSFILTHRCNFRCTYCNVPEKAAAELTTEQFRRALDELTEAGLARASFSGGEALLRPDAMDLIRHARGLGLLTSLNSNAWLAGRVLDQLAPVLDMLVLSLDAPDETHDEVRRQEGSFARVLDVIQGAQARGITVATVSVLGPWNLHRLEEFLELAQRLRFWAYFQPAHASCFELNLHSTFEPKVFQDLAERLTRARAAGLPVGSSPGYLERMARGPNFGDCGRCTAGRYFATLMPDGVMIPCHPMSPQRKYLNGLEVGFTRAFLDMPREKIGAGCAVNPYQETDLLFSMDHRAILAAMRKLFAGPPTGPFRGTG